MAGDLRWWVDFCREDLSPSIIQKEDAVAEVERLFRMTADAVAREMVTSYRLEWW